MEALTMDMLFSAFFITIAADFIFGIIVAKKNGKIKSRVCSDGLFRTMGECVLLLLLAMLNSVFPTKHIMHIFLGFLLLALLFKECVSILENLYQLGVWIPKWARKSLEICADKMDSIDIKELMEDKK